MLGKNVHLFYLEEGFIQEFVVVDITESKNKALENALVQIKKQFGAGAIMKFNGVAQSVDSTSTGSITLNSAIGVGGFPKGRIIEIYGPESSGKTTLCLHAIAEAQKAGGIAAFIDAEHALDISYAKRLGVNVDNLVISQPDNGEQALQIVESLVSSGAVDIVVVDSVAALTPRAEIEGDMGDQHMGLQARLLSHALRKLTSIVSKTNCILIFINQIRMKIGIVYGSPETTTGGNALKFYSSIRLDIRKISAIKDKDVVIGNQTRVKVVKNKVAPPFRQAEFDIMYNEGISKLGEIIDLGTKFNIINKSGSYYSYGNNKMGQGKENVKLYLRSNPAIAKELEDKIVHYLSTNGGSIEALEESSSIIDSAEGFEKSVSEDSFADA